MHRSRRTLLAAALAAAASIHIELPPDPIAGEPLEVRARGVAPPRSLLRAGVSAPGVSCADRYAWVDEIEERAGGGFDVEEDLFSLDSGEHQLCAVLEDEAEQVVEQVAAPSAGGSGRAGVRSLPPRP